MKQAFKSLSFFKKHKSGVFVWTIVFLISFIFITSSTQSKSISKIEDTAGYVYLHEGHDPAMLTSMYRFIAGSSTNVISTAQEDGAIDLILGVTDTFYNEPPASGIVWAQDEVQKLKGLNSITVEAQPDPNDVSLYFPGTGYTVLRPINGLWQWSRNIVYFIFIIVLVIIALFVLFRKNLGGQVTVTIANSLPSIMWAMLFVTLSYPISGFAIDVIYIGAGMVQSIFITGPGAPGNEFVHSTSVFEDEDDRKDINFLQPDDSDISIWGIWGAANANLCTDECKGSDLIPDMNQNDLLAAVGNLLQGLVDVTTSIQIGDNPLVMLILSLAVLQASLKLFVALGKEYVMLILLPIISPFIFMTAAIPNRTLPALSTFIKMLAKSSLSFVAVYALFLFMIVIGQSHNFDNKAFSSIADLKIVPPLLGYSQDQILGGDSIVRTILIFFMFMFAPSVPDLVGELFNIKDMPEAIKRVGRDTGSAFKSWGSRISSVGKAIKD